MARMLLIHMVTVMPKTIAKTPIILLVVRNRDSA